MPDLRASDDSGYSASDNITYQTEGLSFFWEPAAAVSPAGTITYFWSWDDSTPDVATGTTQGADVAAPAAHGAHVFYVRAHNNDGFGPVSSLSVYIDRKAPVVSGLDLRNSDDTGYRNDDNITLDTSVRFTWNGNPNGGSGVHQYRWGWNPSNLLSSTTLTSADVSPPLNNGTMTFHVQAEAASGLTNTDELSLWFDQSVPTSPQPISPSPFTSSPSVSPALKWDFDSERDWKFDVDLESRSSATAPWLDVSGWPRTVLRSGTITASDLVPGRDYRFSVREYDLAGNVAAYGPWSEFQPVASGPRITAFSPPSGADAGPVDQVTVRFSKVIDLATFTAADVRIEHDGTSSPATSVEHADGTAYRIHFNSQSQPGTYVVVVGPLIADLSGNLMNQDEDAALGEATDDQFRGTFNILALFTSGPRIESFGPPFGASAVSYVTARFDRAIAAETFDLSDIAMDRDGIALVPDQLERLTADTYRIHFASQTSAGVYTVKIGPDVKDTSGRLMNQNAPAPNGENPADRFTGTFTLGAPQDETPPSVDLSSPNTGDFQVGQTITIAATSSDASGISHVQVELHQGELSSSSLVGIILPGNIGDGDRSSHAWTIPAVLNGRVLDGTNYKIKWVSWDQSASHNAGFDASTGWLTIRPSATAPAAFIPPWGTSHFDYYAGRSFFYDQDHLGADILLPEGAAIRTGVEGRVVWYAPAEGYGNLVAVIESDLGQAQAFTNAYGQSVSTSKVLWILGHLRPTEQRGGGGQTLNWHVGDTVHSSDLIGFVEHRDDNGDGDEHLHLGLRLQSQADAAATDPAAWFRGYEGSTSMGQYYANPVIALSLTAGVPMTPPALTATAVNNTLVRADWGNVSGAQRYRVERGSSASGPWTVVYEDFASQFDEDGLTLNTQYFYRVIAVNSLGVSAPTSPVAVTTRNDAPPVPTNVNAVGATGGIDVRWDGVIAVGDYILERSPTAAVGFEPIAILPAGQTLYHDLSPKLVAGNVYHYRVQAVSGGITSARSALTSAAPGIPFELIAARPANPGAATADDYSNVASLWRWNFDTNQYTFISPADWSDQGVIDWSKQTIILTHGWDDKLDVGAADEYMNLFALDFEQGRTARNLENYNILAVDWYGVDGAGHTLHNSFGSDPNYQKDNAARLDDANWSAWNGILAAKPFAAGLVDAGLQPTKTMLVGHSNGAGFMASFASTVYTKTRGAKGKIDELVALDAPWQTLSYATTVVAAQVVNRISNYYQPTITVEVTDDQIQLEGSASVGRAMFSPFGSITNFVLRTDHSDEIFAGVIGHSQVPLRYAQTADAKQHLLPWGFQASAFSSGGNSWNPASTFVETAPLDFESRAGAFVPTIPLYRYLGGALLDRVRNFQQSLRDAAFTHARSLWDAGVRIAESIDAALSGMNSATVFGGGSFGGAGASSPWGPAISATAHSPVLASIDVHVPDDAAFLQFDFAVKDMGNADVLQVVLGDHVVGELDLGLEQLSGGGSAQFWVAGHSGEPTAVSFYMPSDVPSTAEFTLSNLRFSAVAETGVDPAELPLPPGIHGSVFHDLDTDGRIDDAEGGVEGRIVYLDLNDNYARDAGEPATVTDGNGRYSFPDVAPGAYNVREDAPQDWVKTFPAPGTGRITNNNYFDARNFRTDGVNVVWQSNEPGTDSEIFMFGGGRTVQLSDNALADRDPQVDGGQVVWEAGGDIYFYDGTRVRQFALPGGVFRVPQISGGQLTWTGFIDGNEEIFFYAGTGNSFEQLTFNSTDDVNPQMDDGIIVWRRGLTNSQIIHYDTTSHSELRIDVNSTENSPPQISHGVMVWYGYDGNDFEIYKYENGSTLNLSSNTIKDDNPDVDNGLIVWRTYVNGKQIVVDDHGSRQQVTNTVYDKDDLRVGGGRAVWGESDGNDYEVFRYEDGVVQPVTNNNVEDGSPQSAGNLVVTSTEDGKGGDFEIFLSTLNDAHVVNIDALAVVRDINFGSLRQTEIPAPLVASITPVAPNPRNTTVDSMSIVFDQPVTGLDITDLRLARDGGSNLLPADQPLTSNDGGRTFSLTNLAALTNPGGSFTLTVVASGSEIVGASGSRLESDLTETFAIDYVLPTVTAATFVHGASPHELAITFSEDVSASLSAGMLAALPQPAGSTPAISPSSVTFDATTNTATFHFDALLPNAAYVATLTASGVRDAAGNPLDGDADGQPSGNFNTQFTVMNSLPLTDEFRVNNTVSGAQSAPSIAMDEAGNFVAVWNSAAQDGSGFAVMAQRYAADGTPLGPEFQVNTYTTGDQLNPAVAMSANGDFVVAWQSFGQDGGEFGIFAQRYDSAGVRRGGEFQVNTFALRSDTDAAVAMNELGEFVIAWYRQGGIDDKGTILVRRYNAAGTEQGGEFVANYETASNQYPSRSPAIAMNRSGQFLVAYQTRDLDGSAEGIFALHSAYSGQFRVNTTTAGAQIEPTVAMNANGELVISWLSVDQNAIFAQRYDALRTPLGGELKANGAANSIPSYPSAAIDGDGDIIFAWQSSSQDGSGQGIYLQRFDSSGTRLGGEFRGNSFTAGDQSDVSLAASPGGRFLAVWSSDGQDGSGSGVYARLYDTDDAPTVLGVGAGGLTINANGRLVRAVSSMTVQFSEAMASSGAASVTNIANWSLTRSGVEVSSIISNITFGFNGTTGKYEATLHFSNPLVNSEYVLTAKDGMRDVSGNALDGNGDGLPTGNFSFPFKLYIPVAVGPEFRANTFTDRDQAYPALAMGNDGAFVIAWHSFRQLGPHSNTYAQRYDAAGTPLGSEFRVNTFTSTGGQTEPTLAMRNDGGFVIAWQSNGQDGSDDGIFFKRYSSAGAALSGDTQVNQYTFDRQSHPSLAMNTVGDFVIAWDSYGDGVFRPTQDGSGHGVYARRFSADGQPRGGEFRVNVVTAGNQGEPAAAMDTAGRFIVVWQSANQDGSGYGIFGRRFDADGNAQGDEFRVNNFPAGDQSKPAVAAAADGSFVVSWTSSGQDGTSSGVYARRYDAGAAPLGNEFRVNPIVSGELFKHGVAMDDDGDFVISWHSPNADGQDVFAKRYNAAGGSEGAEFRVNTFTASDQRNAGVAMDADGDFTIAWESVGQDGSDNGVFVQRFAVDVPTWLQASNGALYSITGGFGSSTLNVTAGTVTFIGDAASTHPNLAVNVTNEATVIVQSAQHLGSINVSSGAVLRSQASMTIASAVRVTGAGSIIELGGALSVIDSAEIDAHGRMLLTQGAGGVLRVVTIGVTDGGTLDLSDNDMIVKGMTYAAVESLVKAGFGNFDWLGTGIMSSSAAAFAQMDGSRAVGVIDNAGGGYETFSGQTVSSTDILVKFTYTADANLDGLIDNDDFGQFLYGFNGGGAARWLNGDFDFNGVVDNDDFGWFLTGLGAFNMGGNAPL